MRINLKNIIHNFKRRIKPFSIAIAGLMLIMLDIYLSLRNDYIFFINIGAFAFCLICTLGKDRDKK